MKAVILSTALLFSLQSLKSQFKGVGINNTYAVTSVGKTSLLGPATDQFSTYQPQLSMMATKDGKFVRLSSGLALSSAMKNSIREAQYRNIIDLDMSFPIKKFGDQFSIGLGLNFLWQKEGLLYPEINDQITEVRRSPVGDKTKGDYKRGSGAYVIKYRAGLGPNLQFLYCADNENFCSRLAFAALTYPSKGMTRIEWSNFIKVSDNITLEIGYRRNHKRIENPKPYRNPNDETDAGNVINPSVNYPYLDRILHIRNNEIFVSFYFANLMK